MAAIYQADMWCDDCADVIRKRLRLEGHAPKNPSDERTYNSDAYPKHADDDEESDSPQHCAAHESCLSAIELPSGGKVGFLFGSLTGAGVAYIRNAALDWECGLQGNEVAALWVQYFSDQGYDLDLVKCLHCGKFVDAA